jgi:hypothetical protein
MDFEKSFYWFDKAVLYNFGEFYELTRNIY